MNCRIRATLIGLLVLLLTACSDDGVLVTAKFANTQDIEDGAQVYFGKKVIGSVSDVSRTEHGSVVQLSLNSALSEAVDSRAAVVVNRLREGAPLELHNPPGNIVKALEPGQTVEALDSMLQLVAWGVTGTVSVGKQSIIEFKEYLQSDEFDREKQQVGIAIDQGLKAANESLADAEAAFKDVTNEMNLSETELAKTVEELGAEMAPIVKELTQGGAELMQELERFADNLEQQSSGDKQTGQEFLKSLTEALETLNKSVDAGLEEGTGGETPPAG